MIFLTTAVVLLGITCVVQTMLLTDQMHALGSLRAEIRDLQWQLAQARHPMNRRNQ